MSADNGLHVSKRDGKFEVYEYDASSGHKTLIAESTTLEHAVKVAENYQRENIVEYGISFDFGDEDEQEVVA